MSVKEKGPSVLEHQTDHTGNIFNQSISQPMDSENLAITMEPVELRDPIALDRFYGNVRSFRLYLKAQLVLLRAGVIAP